MSNVVLFTIISAVNLKSLLLGMEMAKEQIIQNETNPKVSMILFDLFCGIGSSKWILTQNANSQRPQHPIADAAKTRFSSRNALYNSDLCTQTVRKLLSRVYCVFDVILVHL